MAEAQLNETRNTMSTQVSITYFGMDGTGRNVTEAKRDAGRKIEEALSGSYRPVVLESRGWAMLVWRDICGWQSSIIKWVDHDQNYESLWRADVSSGSGEKSFEECLERAYSHLAQMTWDQKELVPPCLEEAGATKYVLPLAKRRRSMLDDFRRWRGFQLAYQHAKITLGDGDARWHQWACEHAMEFADKWPGNAA